MKQNLITEETVFAELKKAIVETLRVDENAIKPESSLIKDLGAESLDFLDINYRLEQTFGIKMARHFILEHIEEMFGEGSAIDENGQLTDKGHHPAQNEIWEYLWRPFRRDRHGYGPDPDHRRVDDAGRSRHNGHPA